MRDDDCDDLFPDLLGPGQTDDVGDGGASVLPTGTVTFLLTDVEGSSRLWEARTEDMGPAIARHYELLDEAIAAVGGVRPVEQGEGDSVVAAFASAASAVAAAFDAQRRLTTELPWLPVRMALHTGEAQLRDEGNYVGRTIIRCARLRSCGFGGQILISETAASIAADQLPPGASLVDLGIVQLRDLARPERVLQLAHPDLRLQFPPLRSLQTVPNNLPAPTTSFVGRESEMAEVAVLSGHARVVTLTGSGGCGKTRLALHVAADVLERYPGGVWWIELAPVSVGSQVPDRFAASIGTAATSGPDPLADVIGFLTQRGSALLVVDNAEHVVVETAVAVEAILRSCPEVRFVVTSREPLGITGESIFRVPSLSTPAKSETVPLADLGRYDAARLFLDRARDARPNLVLDDRTAPAVASICARLDGIPLALELAAARTRAMPIERLAAGLDDAFRLLTGGSRTALARQQTLLASIAWSVDLLDDRERALLRRLAVFNAPFPLDAAEMVAADGTVVDEFAVLDLIGALVDKSLVLFDDNVEHYRMLETIRQFAVDKLRDAGELYSTRRRHAAWVAAWCEAADRGDHGYVFDSAHAIVPEALAALDWALDNEPEVAYRIVRGLGWIRQHLGHYGELDRHYETIIRTPAEGRTSGWARAIAGLMMPSFYLGRTDFAPVADEARAVLDPTDRSTVRLLDAFASTTRGVERLDVSGLQRGLEEAVADGDRMGGVQHARMICAHLMSAGRLDEIQTATDTLAALLATGAEQLTVENSSMAYAALMSVHLERGELAQARRMALTIRPDRQSVTAVVSGMVIARLAAALDDAELLELAAALDRADLPALLTTVGRMIRHHVAHAAGRDADALAEALAAYPHHRNVPGQPSAAFVALAPCMIRAGREAELDSLLLALDQFLESVDDAPLPRAHRNQVAAMLAASRSDVPALERAARALLEIASEHGFVLLAIDGLEQLAEAALARDDHTLAARLYGSAAAERHRTGYVERKVPYPRAVDEVVERLRDEQHIAWQEGAALSLAGAAGLVRRGRGPRARAVHGWDSLTPTEWQVVELVVEGSSNEDVARQLLMSPATVKTHLTHVYAKTDTSNRTELAARYRRR